jgi:hypothetical protein
LAVQGLRDELLVLSPEDWSRDIWGVESEGEVRCCLMMTVKLELLDVVEDGGDWKLGLKSSGLEEEVALGGLGGVGVGSGVDGE